MHRLTAKFDFQVPELPGFLIAAYPKCSPPSYKVIIYNYDTCHPGTKPNNYKVKIELISENTPTISNPTDQSNTFFINRIIIYITREEDDEVPQEEFLYLNFFIIRTREFQVVAMEALSRIILFFKFKLHNPLLYYIHPDSLLIDFLAKEGQALRPKWIVDENEVELTENILKIINPKVISIPNFGFLTTKIGNIKKFTTDLGNQLIDALNNKIEPELYEELIADAQAAAFQGNVRRGVLELAISCEVFVKQSFFNKSSISGLAFEYLDDKQKIKYRVLDLIDDIAKYCFGESFKDNNSKDFEKIDHMFRCRNKIAHKGEIRFKDDKGTLLEVDHKMLEEWFESFYCLVNWLKSKNI